jgi:hypothetical protein
MLGKKRCKGCGGEISHYLNYTNYLWSRYQGTYKRYVQCHQCYYVESHVAGFWLTLWLRFVNWRRGIIHRKVNNG